MSKVTVPSSNAVERKSLKPLSPAEILAKEGSIGESTESFSAIEGWFVESDTPQPRDRIKVDESDAYAEAHPLTRSEIAAKEAAAELRNPKLIATHDGRFAVPKPPEQPQPEIRPAPQTTWD